MQKPLLLLFVCPQIDRMDGVRETEFFPSDRGFVAVWRCGGIQVRGRILELVYYLQSIQAK